MYDLFELSDGTIVQKKVEDMGFDNVKWLDLENPSDDELNDVASTIKIPFHELKLFLDRDELPRITDHDNFTSVVLKAPTTNRNYYHMRTTALTFFISEKLIITLHHDRIAALTRLKAIDKEELKIVLEKDMSYFFYFLLEKITAHYFEILDDIEADIDKIENTVFANPNKSTVRKIFLLKRTLIYFHKGLIANRDMFIHLRQSENPVFTPEFEKLLDHIYYDFLQLLDVAATYRDILTGALDIYLSAVSNNLNLVMKRMAAYGTIVLVPTFITGLYGMNFSFIPELQWKYGYLFAWGTIIVSVALLVWYFKKKDWF